MIVFIETPIFRKQFQILNVLIKEGLTYQRDIYENFLIKTDFVYSSEILNEVTKHDSKVALYYLDKEIKLDSSETETDFCSNLGVRELMVHKN